MSQRWVSWRRFGRPSERYVTTAGLSPWTWNTAVLWRRGQSCATENWRNYPNWLHFAKAPSEPSLASIGSNSPWEDAISGDRHPSPPGRSDGAAGTGRRPTERALRRCSAWMPPRWLPSSPTPAGRVSPVKRRWGLSSLSKWPLSELFWRWRPSSRARSQLKGCVGKIHCSFFDGWIRLEHLFETFFAKLRIGKIIDLKTKIFKKVLNATGCFFTKFHLTIVWSLMRQGNHGTKAS